MKTYKKNQKNATQYSKYGDLTMVAIATGKTLDLREDTSSHPWEIRITKGKGKGKLAWIENSDPELIEQRLEENSLGVEWECV